MAELKAQRKQVKRLAAEVDATINEYKHQTKFQLRTNRPAFHAKLREKQAEVQRLQEKGVSDTAPQSGIVRSVKSGTLLSAAATSRVAAIVAGGTTGAVHATYLGACVARIAVQNLALNGIVQGVAGTYIGGKTGARAPSYLAPLTVPIGAVTVGAFGVVSGLAEPIANLPGNAMNATYAAIRRGSPTRNAYNKVDQLATAIAHTKRKKQSPQQILNETSVKLAATIERMQSKNLHERSFLQDGPFFNWSLLELLESDPHGFRVDDDGTVIRY